MKNNKWILYSAIVGFCFLWTGTSYISQVYRLFGLYEPVQVDVFSQIIYYLMQVIGIAIFMYLIKRYPDIAKGHYFFVGIIMAEAIVISSVLTVSNSLAIVTLGFIMNFLHGMVAGYYLWQLSKFVPKEHRGKAFGFGYAFGSIGTWIISLPFGGNFLKSKTITLVYLLLMAVSVILVRLTDRVPSNNREQENCVPQNKEELWKLLFICIVLLTFAKTVGFSFPFVDIVEIVNVEFSRAFYAIGLIIAGVITDKSRKFGASLALMTIIFPFAAIALNANASFLVTIWAMGYIFFGLLAVYRVVVFLDYAAKSESLIYLAAMGLLAGRIGDVLGTIGGVLYKNDTVVTLALSGVASIVVIPLFLSIYQKMYIHVITEESSLQLRCRNFENKYELSEREGEVFRLIVLGCSNREIASKLYISESTVKFHVSNILKKTGCHNRAEIKSILNN